MQVTVYVLGGDRVELSAQAVDATVKVDVVDVVDSAALPHVHCVWATVWTAAGPTAAVVSGEPPTRLSVQAAVPLPELVVVIVTSMSQAASSGLVTVTVPYLVVCIAVILAVVASVILPGVEACVNEVQLADSPAGTKPVELPTRPVTITYASLSVEPHCTELSEYPAPAVVRLSQNGFPAKVPVRDATRLLPPSANIEAAGPVYPGT